MRYSTGTLAAHKRGYNSDRDSRVELECKAVDAAFASVPCMSLPPQHPAASLMACSRGGFVLSALHAEDLLIKGIKRL